MNAGRVGRLGNEFRVDAMGLLAAFLRDERGSYTIEFCLWIPMFLVFLAATVDASLLYLTHNNMWNAARDTARRVSTGEIDSKEEAYEALERRLVYTDGYVFGYGKGNDGDGNVAKIVVQIPMADASLFNIFAAVNWWFGSFSPGEETYSCGGTNVDSAGTIMGCLLHAEVTMALEPALN